MKPEFLRLRRAFAGVVAAVLMAAGLVVLSPALSASAHNNEVTADCTSGLTVDLSSYPEATTVEVVIDSATVTDISFGGDWNNTYAWNRNVDHTYTVTVGSPDDPNGYNHWSFTTTGSVEGCPPADTPTITLTGTTCSTQSSSNGTVTFLLSGATKSYTVALMTGATLKATTTSSGGSGGFSNVAAGTYTLKASADGVSVSSSPFTVATCTQTTPDIDLIIQPCVGDGAQGAVTANLGNLVVGSNYLVALYSSSDVLLDTVPLTATATSHSTLFPDQGPGQYYVAVSDAEGSLLATSADATILDCAAGLSITVLLEPCLTPLNGTDRAINVQLAGLEASTVYTVQLLTDDAAQTVVASTTTPGDSAATFPHTFTAVPSPGDYVVTVTGASTSVTSDSVSAPRCDLTTLAPPSIELVADQCDASGTGISPLSARMIDLDATKTYFVRIVDTSGATVAGGEDQEVTGSTTATVRFPKISSSGTYSAQLLINPGKQLAATSSPSSVNLRMCLPTLAMTGPGVLVPLGSVAALLLTLGGAVVTGRLRRRMAL